MSGFWLNDILVHVCSRVNLALEYIKSIEETGKPNMTDIKVIKSILLEIHEFCECLFSVLNKVCEEINKKLRGEM